MWDIVGFILIVIASTLTVSMLGLICSLAFDDSVEETSTEAHNLSEFNADVDEAEKDGGD